MDLPAIEALPRSARPARRSTASRHHLRVGAVRVLDGDAGEREVEELLHLRHRLDEARALGSLHGLEGPSGESIAKPIELLELREARDGQEARRLRRSDSRGATSIRPSRFEGTQQPAEVTRVEVQSGAKLPDVRTLLSDLEQQRDCASGRSRPRKRSVNTPTRRVSVR
jgi:hypothetical protein